MRRLVVGVVVLAALSAASRETVTAEGARSHAIYMSAVEFKGSTTTDKVPAPPVDPGKMSRGYAYRGPGQADLSAPHRWEVASYQFSPAFVTVQQGDSIMLSVFVANGDRHDVELTDPDGESIITNTTWLRGREYTAFFQARKLGTYHLECSIHAPSMTAEILVVPR